MAKKNVAKKNVAKKQTRRPTTVPTASAVRNPKGRGAKPGFIDLPDADDIWDQINFWSGRQDHLLQPEVIAAKDVAKGMAKGADIYYTGGLGGSFYDNVLRPQTDINSSTNANWGAFGRDAAVAAATAGAAGAIAKGVKIAAKSVKIAAKSGKTIGAIDRMKRAFMPGEIGVHHSVTAPGARPFTGNVAPSGQYGFTAGDQIPGYSYFWSTAGKDGGAKAAQEAAWQTQRIADIRLLDEGQNAVGYVTRMPYGKSIPDVNVPGGFARAVKGGQRVVKAIEGTGDVYSGAMRQLSPGDLRDIAAAVNRAKMVERAKSTAKIGGAAAATAAAAETARRNFKRNVR